MLRLFAFDLDQTLLVEGSIKGRNRNCLRALQNAGKTIALVTGRVLRSPQFLAAQAGLRAYCIGSNGAVVATPDGKVLYKEAIPTQTAVQLIQIGIRHRVGVWRCAGFRTAERRRILVMTQETRKDQKRVDILIIGAGPAGLSAALYAARSGKSVVVLEKETIGGQMMVTAVVENMPGGDNDPSVLASRMKEQAQHFGAQFLRGEVIRVTLEGLPKCVETEETIWEAGAVILATGANPRKLGLDNEDAYIGRGLGYCATCDGPFFAGLPIYVVGGGDAAFDESLYLSTLSDTVTILYRGPVPRATKLLQERAKASGKVQVVLNTEVVRLGGDPMLSSFVMKNNVTGEEKTIEGDFGLFIYIGMIPNTSLYKEQILLDDAGYIVAGEDTKTNLQGVFAAGDVRTKTVRQIVGALSDGATAAIEAGRYLDQQNK